MTTKINNSVVIRLLLKISRCIGSATFQYVSLLLESNTFSAIELEILERIFTMGCYTNDIIEKACFTARCKQITNVVEFNFLVSKIDYEFYQRE